MADFSLGSFDKRINRRADQLEKSVRRILKAAAKEAHRAFVEATPVDTGNARSNTRLDTSPTVIVRDNKDIGGIGPATTLALARAVGTLAKVQDVRTSLYITNGVDYIRLLDSGLGSRKGGFMSASAVLAGRAAVRREKAKGIFRG